MDDLRSDLLALWRLRRRQLDDLLAPLLVQNSLAATRVVENLADVIAAADNERAAFEAFLAAHERVEEDLAEQDEAAGRPPADLDDDELSEARQRIVAATDLHHRAGHPSQTGLPAEADPPATVHQLTPRGNGRRKR